MTDPDQQEKLRRLTKPFSVAARKSKEGFLREQDIDDMLSEISTPEIDYSERKRIMEALDKREKLREEAELQSCLESLTGKSMDLGDGDSVMSKSSSDLKQLKDKPNQVNIYKPNIPTPKQAKPAGKTAFAQYVQQEERK